MGDVVEFQHTGWVVQRQVVCVGKRPPARERQRVRTNVEFSARVAQGHASSNLHGRIVQIREVGSDAHILSNLQPPSAEGQRPVVNCR